MPLQVAWSYRGINLNEAHVRLVRLDATEALVTAFFSVYANVEAWASGCESIDTVHCCFVPDLSESAPSLWAQAHVALRAEPTFAEAISV